MISIIDVVDFFVYGIGGILAAVMFLAVFVSYRIKYGEDLRNAKNEKFRARTHGEYYYWKQEVRCIKWAIVPGVTPKGLRRFVRKLWKLVGKPGCKQVKKA